MAEVLGLAASVIAVVDLFVKVGVLCSLYCADLKKAPRDVRHILNEADKLTATLKDVERLLASPNAVKINASQNIHRSVADCRQQLDDLAAKLEEGTKYKRILWPLKKEEVAEIIKNLERCRTAICSDLHISQAALLLDIHQEVVLAKLRTAEGASFDSYTDADSARCHPGTRVDILQRIQAWAETSDGENIFWLNGMAGTGKSTISRTAAQSFADKGMLGASFFFKRGEGDRGRAALFFTTIAAQLVSRLPSLAPYIQDEIKADPAINEKLPKDQFDKLIAGPINKLPDHPQPSTITVVVDALDECDSLEHARLIIRLLSQAKQFASIRLKFFVTSRPELPIQLSFSDIDGKYEGLLLHQIPRPIIEHDISVFLQHELARIRQDYNSSVMSNRQLPPHWPGKEPVQKLVTMAIPLFVFAATACRFIQDRRLGGPKDQLAIILEHEMTKSKLDATYLPVLNQLLLGLTGLEKHGVAEKFKQVVGSIITLASPLSIPSLAHLIRLSPDTIEDQLDFLHSVLSIPSDQNMPVRLLHLSFREFLVDPEKCEDQEKYPFWVDERESHKRLAVHCLQLLSEGDTLKKDICDLRLPGTLRSEVDQQTIDAGLPSVVQYACRYWVYHWKESKCRIRDGDLVNDFLIRYLLHWLEALGLIGRISESISMVDDLISLLDKEESRHISAFLHDARRIILSHSSIIDISPLQVYYSAIIFAPEQSIIRNNFRSQFPSWLSQLPQVNQDWGPCLQTLEGHYGYINSIVFSHDSTALASASSDTTIKLWNIATGTCTATLDGHEMEVNSVAFSHDSTVLASASGDTTIKFWNIATGTCTATLDGHEMEVNSVVFSHDSTLLASASDDTTIKLWDVATGTCTATLDGHEMEVNSVAFSHDSTLLASASGDTTIKLWDVATGSCTAMLDGHEKTVNSVAFSHDSTILASASGDASIKLWNPITHACIATIDYFVFSIAFSHDSKILASAAPDNSVKLWNIIAHASMAEFQGHTGMVFSVAFSHDSKILASSSDDTTIKLWDLVTGAGAYIETLDRHMREVTLVAFSYKLKTLVSASRDNTIKLWDPTKGTCIATLRGHNNSVLSIAFSHDSKILASSSLDNTIKLWDPAIGACTATLQGHNSGVFSVAFSYDSKILASSSSDNSIKLWHPIIPAFIATLQGHYGTVFSIAFSYDSKILASASDDGTVKLWDPAIGACISTLQGHNAQVTSITFSHDSKILASSSPSSPIGRTIKLWDPATGACTATIDIYDDRCIDLSFDTTGCFLYFNHCAFAIEQLLKARSSILATPEAVLTETPHSPTPAPTPRTLLQSINHQGIGLSTDLTWVTWNSQRVLWLPPVYRPNASAVMGSTVSVGCSSGLVFFVSVLSSRDLLP